MLFAEAVVEEKRLLPAPVATLWHSSDGPDGAVLLCPDGRPVCYRNRWMDGLDSEPTTLSSESDVVRKSNRARLLRLPLPFRRFLVD